MFSSTAFRLTAFVLFIASYNGCTLGEDYTYDYSAQQISLPALQTVLF